MWIILSLFNVEAKSLTTQKSFLTSVDLLVYTQVTTVRKRLTAHITKKGFMTSVNLLVCADKLFHTPDKQQA